MNRLARSSFPLVLIAAAIAIGGCGLKYGSKGSVVGGGAKQQTDDGDDSDPKPAAKKKTPGAPITFAKAKEDEDYQSLASMCADDENEDQEAACKLAKSHAKNKLAMACPAKSLVTELTDEDSGMGAPMRWIYQKHYRKEFLDKMAACGQWDLVFKGAVVPAQPDDYDRFVAAGKDVMAAFEKYIDTHPNLGETGTEAPKTEDAYPLGYTLSWLARNNATSLAPKLVLGAKAAPLHVKLSVIKFTQAVKYAEGAALARDLLDDADPQKRAKGCQILADLGDTQSYAKVKALADADPTRVTDKGTTTFPVRTACLAASTRLDPKNATPAPSGSAKPGAPPGASAAPPGSAAKPPPKP